ncbi:hypothetical protein FC857_14355 [Salmonella enterica]|uniref:Uncharacterized protein n=2 Tax=Salmonella enterica TaxID=28901 RepID=A0A629RJY2_SALER|nr:hypothetical protein [Salmonella enterica]EAS1588246.1 hypothetical protein [Salmonella enterica]EAT8178940.1 hypothetical protein [Salmonella enterica]EAV7763846.1 hypothetical protein [Salmonella enterica]EAW3346495.1 hypothetical protein [Salmonella enterica]EAW3530824.1 hypothetical protein [Salmonella enterica]
MLEGYFKLDGLSGEPIRASHKRLLAVQAALEIVKASAASAAGDSSTGKMYQDLHFASENIEKLADAIQDALEIDEEE